MSEQLAAFVPETPLMRSQTYAAPMSFIGSARRLLEITRRLGAEGPAQAVGAWLFFAVSLSVAWAAIFFWYVIAFGVFGVFTIPFRFFRRGQRKSLAVQEKQLATMQAMMLNQQRLLSQHREPEQQIVN